MASPYTGAARPATPAQDALQMPLAAKPPKVNIPADTDPNNAASLFVSQYRTLADFLAFVQTSARFCPSIASSGGTGGFSTVSRIGSGAGVVTPTGPCNTALYCVVKIILGGAVGTATFQFSSDGGVTYTSTNTTAASWTDPTTGVTLAFSGNFVTDDLYTFHSAFSPAIAFTDYGGIIHDAVDHLGFVGMGHISEFREEWLYGAGGANLSSNEKWTSGPGLGVGSSIKLVYPTTDTPWSEIAIAAAASDLSSLLSKATPFIRYSGGVLVFETNAWVNNLAFANNANFGLGSLFEGIGFNCGPGATNWMCSSSIFGGGSTSVDSGVAVGTAANQRQRFRIELHGSTSTYGERAIFFINERVVANITTNLTTSPLGVVAGASSTGGGSTTLHFGSFVMRWNRWNPSPAV